MTIGKTKHSSSSEQFEYAYIIGAVCPKKDRIVGLVLPTIRMGCMQKHLEIISKEIEPGHHGDILCDAWNASTVFKKVDLN